MKLKYFSDAFLDSLPDDHLLGVSAICSEYRKFDREAEGRLEYIGDYLSSLAIFQAYATSNNYQMNPSVPATAADPQNTINNIRNFFVQNEGEITRLLNGVYLQRETQKFEARFQSEFAYVFSEDDFNHIQKLINEMRDIVMSSDIITAKHKQRLLERLERLQKELHKTTSDLDRFWGFVGEAGIVIGKFGKDIQPLVDRIKELTNIVWKVIAMKELLLDNSNPIALPEPKLTDNKTVAT
jgi:hypothetical protein